MASITIVGNIMRDTYLAIDTHYSPLETDQHGRPWLSTPFDAENVKYFRNTDTLGGSAITLDIFQHFKLDATLTGNTDKHHLTKRYILTHEDHTLGLFPSTPIDTPWVKPEKTPEYLYLDRSANLTDAVAIQILDYLADNPTVQLIVFVNKRFDFHDNPLEQKIIARASLLIADIPIDTIIPTLHIGDQKLIFNDLEVSLDITERARVLTTLTAHTLIASGFIGAYLSDHDAKTSLLLATENFKQSTLTHSPSLRTLEESILGQDYLIATDTRPEIEQTAARLMIGGKGILAADESGGSIHKKFEAANIPDDEEHRRTYRNIFFTTPNIEKSLSGIILFDETARQYADNGETFVQFIANRGIIPGVKVDQGLEPIPESPIENYTKGLDGLDARLTEYYEMGARFAKWRAAFKISDNTPSELAIDKNCRILADYAKLCQDHNIVPIVEPEVVYDGWYGLEKSKTTTVKVLSKLFIQLQQRSVNLKGLILKTNMCLAGSQMPEQSTPEQVGQATAEVLRATCPDDLAGVVFLSGGQTPEQATANLAAVITQGPFPWPVSFSFARALQEPALKAWKNDPAQIPAAQVAFSERLQLTQRALLRH